MTVCYLGTDVAYDDVTQLQTDLPPRLQPIAPVPARISALRYWPRAHVLVAELDASAAMQHLFQTCQRCCRTLGLPVHAGSVSPHITLAYLPRDCTTPPSIALPTPPDMPIMIDHIMLLQTIPGGYAPHGQWPLTASPA